MEQQQKTYVFDVETVVKRKFKNVSVSAVTEDDALKKVKELVERAFKDTEVISVKCHGRTRRKQGLKAKIERLKKQGFQYIGEPLDENKLNCLWYNEKNMPDVAFMDKNGKVLRVNVQGPVTVNIMDGDNVIAAYNGNMSGTLETALGSFIKSDKDIQNGLRKETILMIDTNWYHVDGTNYNFYNLGQMFEAETLKKLF